MDSKIEMTVRDILDKWQDDIRSRAVAFEPGRKPLATSRDVAKQICVLFEKPEPQESDLREKVAISLCAWTFSSKETGEKYFLSCNEEIKANWLKEADMVLEVVRAAGYRPHITEAQQDELPKLKEPQLDTEDTGLREKVAELNLHYLELLRARDDYTPAMVETELTGLVMDLLAGYHHCQKVEWPVLTEEYFTEAQKRFPDAPCTLAEKLEAQRDADRAHCPAQEGK